MDKEQIDILGDNHISTSIETPMLPNAFEKSDDEKIKIIQHHFGEIMETLGMDLSDDSLSGELTCHTPGIALQSCKTCINT